MKALVIGLGSAGRRHARNWARLRIGDLLVCRQAGSAQPEPLGVEARVFDRLDEALAEQPDLAIVTNPTALHVATALGAVRANCHVLVEKPLGSSLGGVSELLREAAERGRQVFVGYNLRFHPGLTRLRELLHAGAIGRPLSARAEMGEYLPGWHPWEDYRQGYSARSDLGGGPILTFSHELDSICWLLGAPRHVSCVARHVSDLAIDTEDVADMLLDFGGPIASVHVDYLRQPPRRQLEIIGEAGILRWEYDEQRLLHYADGGWREETVPVGWERNDLFLDELRAIVACLRGEPPPDMLADGAQGAAILALALAAKRADRESRTLDLTEDPETAGWLTRLSAGFRGPAG